MENRTKFSVIGGAVIALILLIIAFSTAYTVDEGERGVVLRNGAYQSVAEPGLHFKWPFIDSVKFITVQNQASKWDKLQAYSKDQQPATLTVSVSYRVLPTEVPAVYKGYTNMEGLLGRAIARQVPTQVENVFGRYTAVEAVQKRAEMMAAVATAIRESVTGPVIIDSVQVENIDFSDAYESSIEELMKVEVAVKTRDQTLKTELIQAKITVAKAQATADSNLALATSEAKAIELKGNAEAEAIKSRAAALSSNQNLVELTKAEKWNGVLPTTVLPNGALPFIDAKK